MLLTRFTLLKGDEFFVCFIVNNLLIPRAVLQEISGKMYNIEITNN